MSINIPETRQYIIKQWQSLHYLIGKINDERKYLTEHEAKEVSIAGALSKQEAVLYQKMSDRTMIVILLDELLRVRDDIENTYLRLRELILGEKQANPTVHNIFKYSESEHGLSVEICDVSMFANVYQLLQSKEPTEFASCGQIQLF